MEKPAWKDKERSVKKNGDHRVKNRTRVDYSLTLGREREISTEDDAAGSDLKSEGERSEEALRADIEHDLEKRCECGKCERCVIAKFRERKDFAKRISIDRDRGAIGSGKA